MKLCKWHIKRLTTHYEKKDITREKLLSMMAGGEELNKLEVELEEMNRLSSQ